MSNKDLLKLENEYRNELPEYKEKPKITQIEKPHVLTKRVTNFLARIEKGQDGRPGQQQQSKKSTNKEDDACVEMDIYLTPSD